MSDQVQQVLQQALVLAPEERVKVAELLLSSLDSESLQRIDSLWAAEAESRLDALDRGEIKSVPAREVFNRILKPKS